MQVLLRISEMLSFENALKCLKMWMLLGISEIYSFWNISEIDSFENAFKVVWLQLSPEIDQNSNKYVKFNI